MSIRIHNFMGIVGWTLQKKLPKLSSESYLKLQFIRRRKSQKAYIDYFLSVCKISENILILVIILLFLQL